MWTPSHYTHTVCDWVIICWYKSLNSNVKALHRMFGAWLQVPFGHKSIIDVEHWCWSVRFGSQSALLFIHQRYKVGLLTGKRWSRQLPQGQSIVQGFPGFSKDSVRCVCVAKIRSHWPQSRRGSWFVTCVSDTIWTWNNWICLIKLWLIGWGSGGGSIGQLI